MHSALVRLQNSFGFFTTVAFCIAILVALSVTVHPQSPSANIELRNVQVYAYAAPHFLTQLRFPQPLFQSSKLTHEAV